MMNQPGVFIKADHGHVAHNTPFFLVNKMSGDVRILIIEFFICFFDLLFILLNQGIFIRINKTGFKKEIPKIIQINRVAYIDIDAHHGDGVFYSFENDPDLIFVDFHEDGRFLYPGTGDAAESGNGDAKGTKLNIPMPPAAGDELFIKLWPRAEEFIRKSKPEFVLIQCGADSIAGDPITHMAYSTAAHHHAVTRLCHVANEFCDGRVVAMGGGGYNLDNIAKTWTAVVSAMIDAD